MSKNARNIAILSIVLILTIGVYPIIVDKLISYYSHYQVSIVKTEVTKGKSIIPRVEEIIERDKLAERGTFGDMYGLLNTLFSGLALIGVVYSIVDEKEKSRREKINSQKEKLAYFNSVLNVCYSSANTLTYKITLLINELKNEPYKYENHLGLKVDTSISRIQNILNKLNEEDYFLAFVHNVSLEKDIFLRSGIMHLILDEIHQLPSDISNLNNRLYKAQPEILKIKNEILDSILSAINDNKGYVDELFTNSYLNWFNSDNTLYDVYILYSSIEDVVYQDRKRKTSGYVQSDIVTNLIIKRTEIDLNFKLIRGYILSELKDLEIICSSLGTRMLIIKNEIDNISKVLKT